MNFLELCQALRREAGISGTGPASVAGQTGEMLRVVQWIKSANLAIQNIPVSWDFLYNTFTLEMTSPSPGVVTNSYSLEDLGVGTPVKTSFTAYDPANPTETWRLRDMSYQEWLYKTMRSPKGTGKVATAILKPRGILSFDPVPDKIYMVEFDGFMAPMSLVDNTDIPTIPEGYHDIIVQKALIEYARFENAVEVFQAATAEYTKLLDAMKRDHIVESVLVQRPLC